MFCDHIIFGMPAFTLGLETQKFSFSQWLAMGSEGALDAVGPVGYRGAP
jgi:hypothetical protein